MVVVRVKERNRRSEGLYRRERAPALAYLFNGRPAQSSPDRRVADVDGVIGFVVHLFMTCQA